MMCSSILQGIHSEHAQYMHHACAHHDKQIPRGDASGMHKAKPETGLLTCHHVDNNIEGRTASSSSTSAAGL